MSPNLNETTHWYQVGDVAEIAGITVRTLHHYDEIELLVPSGRTAAGYRLYDDDDLLRLQQILIGRELGLSLETIRRTLDDPGFDRRQALVDQRRQLARRAQRAERMLRAVDAALAALDYQREGDIDMQRIFDGFDPAEHADEARERWGDTDAWTEANRRTESYGEEDWEAIQAEQNALWAEAAQAMHDGVAPGDDRATELAERLRLLIDRWFYPCDHAMHRALADMYESDPRFRRTIDAHGEGLTAWVAGAIRANAAGQV